MSHHTCDALGVCQHHTPACLGCDHHALDASVQASRDTGCCVPFGADTAATDILSRAERVGYWAAVGAVVGLSVVAFFGACGYLFMRFNIGL